MTNYSRLDCDMRLIFKQFIKYSIVGGIGYLLHLGLMVLLTEAVGLHYLVASGISPVAIVTFNFVLNRSWTFRGNYASLDVSTSVQRGKEPQEASSQTR